MSDSTDDWREDDDRRWRWFCWSMGLFLVAVAFFQTPAGPLGIPIAVAGCVCGYKSGK